MRPHVALLNCSSGADDAYRNFRRELPAIVHEYDAQHSEFPEPGRELDGVVVSGSRSSVLDDEQWIRDTEEWVAAAHETGLPVFGVCFGHQVLATALGGRVEEMDEFEVGFTDVRKQTDEPLLSRVDDEFTAFQFHEDEVVELPSDAAVVAANDRCAVQAFRAGQSMGVQFHPEFDLHTVQSALEERDVRPERINEVLEGVVKNVREFTRIRTVYEQFCEYALDSEARAVDRRAVAG